MCMPIDQVDAYLHPLPSFRTSPHQAVECPVIVAWSIPSHLRPSVAVEWYICQIGGNLPCIAAFIMTCGLFNP